MLVTGEVTPPIPGRVFVAAPVTWVTAAGGVPPECVAGTAAAKTLAVPAETLAVAAETVAVAAEAAAAAPGTRPVAPDSGAAVGGAGAVPPEPAALVAVLVAVDGAEGDAAGEPGGGAEGDAPDVDDPPGSVAVTEAVAEPSVLVTVLTVDPTRPVTEPAGPELPETGDVIRAGAG